MPVKGDRKPVLERFWPKFDEVETGCWLWNASLYPSGYGIFFHGENGRRDYRPAHRVSYELFRGPIPPGMQLDHLCRVRCCVNPWHTEPVTNAENVKRGYDARGLKTHCKWGHEFTDENTKISSWGARICRTCTTERWHGRRSA